MKTLNLKDLYIEIETDPDLRRLGPYKVINSAERPSHLFPIDVVIPDKDLFLGEGDFTDCFVALCETKARKVNFGSCIFTELYLDFLEADEIDFDASVSSRVFFDSAKCIICKFSDSKSSETYFDTAHVKKVSFGNLTTGIVFPAASKIDEVVDNPANLNKYVFAFDKPEQNIFGNIKILTTETSDIKNYELSTPKALSASEFMEEVRANPDLRRLGTYEVVGDHVVVDLNDESFSRTELHLGNGKFTSVTFTATAKLKSVHFDNAHIGHLNLGEMTVDTMYFSHLNNNTLNFSSASIDRCYLDDARSVNVDFAESHINEIHAMRLGTSKLSMSKLQCNEFNFNRMKAGNVMCDNANLGNLQLSNANGVKAIHFGNAAVNIVNLHESKIDLLEFENATINRAYINKSHVRTVKVQDLVSNFLYVDNVNDSYIGELIVGANQGVKHLELSRILPGHGIKISDEKKSSFGTLSFGSNTPEDKNSDRPKMKLH